MPILKKKSGGKGGGGDFLAVLLLLAIVAGLGWLWWRQHHPAAPAKSPLLAHVVQRPRPEPPPEKKAPKPVPAVQPVLTPIPVPVPPAAPPKPVVAPAPTVPVTVSVVPPVLPAVTSSVPAKPISQIVPEVAPPVSPEEDFRPVRSTFEAQMALARRGISPGPIDGANGSQTRAALKAFQRAEGLAVSGVLDTNTRAALTFAEPLLTSYLVTTNDLARLQPVGKTWLAKSEQSALEYETILELVAEKSHAHPLQIQKLNPGVHWSNVVAGTVLKLPAVAYPEPEGKATLVVIHLAEKYLEAFDAETNLLLHCPCSIAARVEKRPVGELHVSVVAPHPNYTFDPAVFPESPEAQAIGRKLILPPGPNNPVGMAWIGLDKPGYGMHGTPVPEQVGRTESHGCFRLANWDAEYLVKLVWVGLPVIVVP